jgi:hypothetical protein
MGLATLLFTGFVAFAVPDQVLVALLQKADPTLTAFSAVARK